jgi:hypothetical protein
MTGSSAVSSTPRPFDSVTGVPGTLGRPVKPYEFGVSSGEAWLRESVALVSLRWVLVCRNNLTTRQGARTHNWHMPTTLWDEGSSVSWFCLQGFDKLPPALAGPRGRAHPATGPSGHRRGRDHTTVTVTGVRGVAGIASAAQSAPHWQPSLSSQARSGWFSQTILCQNRPDSFYPPAVTTQRVDNSRINS